MGSVHLDLFDQHTIPVHFEDTAVSKPGDSSGYLGGTFVRKHTHLENNLSNKGDIHMYFKSHIFYWNISNL